MIAAEFQLTSDDYAEAQVTHLTKAPGRIIILAIIALGAGFVVTLFITASATRHEILPAWIFLGAMLLFVVLLRSKVVYRMQFNRTKALHDPIHFEAGDNGVVFRTQRGETTTKWEGLEKWRESKGSFLLYPQRRLFFVVPKRVLDVGQVVAFRELLRNHIQ